MLEYTGSQSHISFCCSSAAAGWNFVYPKRKHGQGLTHICLIYRESDGFEWETGVLMDYIDLFNYVARVGPSLSDEAIGATEDGNRTTMTVILSVDSCNACSTSFRLASCGSITLRIMSTASWSEATSQSCTEISRRLETTTCFRRYIEDLHRRKQW